MSLVNEVFKVYNYVPVYDCNQQYKVLHYFLMIYGYYYYSMYFYCTCTSMSTYLIL